MSQLTLYLPDETAARLKAEARRAKKSLSAYVLEKLQGRGTEQPSSRRKRLAALYGSADLPTSIEDEPPDEPLTLEGAEGER